MCRFHSIVAAVWTSSEVPLKCIDTTIKVAHKEKDRTECGSYRGISRLAKLLPTGSVASSRRQASSREKVRILAPTIDHLHDVRGKPTTRVGTCEQRPPKRVLHRSTVGLRFRRSHARFVVPLRIIKAIRISHDGMRMRV